jgi:hypothetical protein
MDFRHLENRFRSALLRAEREITAARSAALEFGPD